MMTLILASVLGCDVRYAAPAYSAQSYASPVYSYSYAAPAKVVYQAVNQYAQPAYNYQSLVGSYLREEQAYKAQLDQNAKLDQLIQLFRQQAVAPPQPFQAPPVYPQPPAPPKATPQSYQAPPVPTPQAPEPADVPPPPPAPGKVVPSFSSVAPAAYHGMAQAMPLVMGARCVRCHGAEKYVKDGGGLKFAEADGSVTALAVEMRDDILKATRAGRMPKGGPRLDGSEVATLYVGLEAMVSRQPAPIAGAFGGD